MKIRILDIQWVPHFSLTLGEVGIFLTRKTAPYRTFTLSSEVGVQSSCGGFADPTGVFSDGEVSKLNIPSRSLANSSRRVRCTPGMNRFSIIARIDV